MLAAEICRRAGIGPATCSNWKKKYDGLLPTEMKRLKQLEGEDGRLRDLVVDLSLDCGMLQGVLRRKLRGLTASAIGWRASVATERACPKSSLKRLSPMFTLK